MYVIDNWGHGKQGKCAKGTFYKPRGTVRGVSKLSMSVYKWGGGSRGWSMWSFSGLEPLFSINDFQKNNLQHNYQKGKVHMVRKRGQPKVHV